MKNFFIKGGVRFDMSLNIPIDKTVMTKKEQEEEVAELWLQSWW
jgi:hypothetical protein